MFGDNGCHVRSMYAVNRTVQSYTTRSISINIKEGAIFFAASVCEPRTTNELTKYNGITGQSVRWFKAGHSCDLDLECVAKSHVLVRFEVLCSMAAHDNFCKILNFTANCK